MVKNIMDWKQLWAFFFAKPIEIYTDGSVKHGRGTWAFVVVSNSKIIHEASGSESYKATRRCNNRMEFQAAIEALRWLRPQSRAVLYSDSRNLVDCLNLWMEPWSQQGWVKKNQSPIPNVDQLKLLYELSKRHKLEWKWVRAHAGHVFNERCDELCRQ